MAKRLAQLVHPPPSFPRLEKEVFSGWRSLRTTASPTRAGVCGPPSLSYTARSGSTTFSTCRGVLMM